MRFKSLFYRPQRAGKIVPRGLNEPSRSGRGCASPGSTPSTHVLHPARQVFGSIDIAGAERSFDLVGNDVTVTELLVPARSKKPGRTAEITKSSFVVAKRELYEPENVQILHRVDDVLGSMSFL